MIRSMHLTLIAAAAENNVIGRDGELPWRLPADMAWFRRHTIGHPVIMGRRTWETLPAPLKDRLNIVLTRKSDLQLPGAVVANGPDDALTAAEPGPAFVIGGGDIYRLFLPLADRVLLTRVHATTEGDTLFPSLDTEWVLMSEEHNEADDRHPHAMTFQQWDRP